MKLGAAILLASAAVGWALINPNFTPVHLVRQSEQIVEVELAAARPGAFTYHVTRALKGDAPKMTGILDPQQFLSPGRALLFIGPATGGAAVGLLQAGTKWYRLTRAVEGPWRAEARQDQLQATWAGGTEMLARCVEYILTTPNPSVPAATTERWSAPVLLTTNITVAGNLLRIEGDFTGEGRFDVLEPGKLLWNRGDGTFTNVWAESGEPVQLLKSNVTGLAVCDINLDGRQDFVVFYADAPPQVFFNRGFRTFGLSTSLQLPASVGGQRAGVVADFNGDGLPDLALETHDGKVFVFHCLRDNPPALLLRARSRLSDPVTAVAWTGKRCLGARSLAPGDTAVWGSTEPGPYAVEWRGSNGVTRRREIKVLNQPVTVILDPD